MPNANAQTLRVHNRIHRDFTAHPITIGVPWPQGDLTDVAALSATDESGNTIPAAFKSLNAWPDGSIQWALIDTAVDLAASGDRHLTVRAESAAAPDLAHPIIVHVDGDQAVIGNGRTALTVSAQPGQLVQSWTADGRPLAEPDGLDITFEDESGQQYSVRAAAKTLSIEHANPLRAILRVEGKHAPASGDGLLDFFIRFEVFADRPEVKITYSFRNRELPTPGIVIQNLRIQLNTTVAPDATRCFTATNRTRHYLNQFMRVNNEDPHIIASDTGDIDNYKEAHDPKASHGECFVANPDVLHDPHEDKPWFLRDQKYRKQAGGEKCVWPYLALLDPQGGVLTAIGAMTSLHPKELTVQGSTFTYGLFPDWAGPLSITQGAGRSHVIYVSPVPAGADDTAIQDQYLGWEFGGMYSHVPASEPVEIAHDIDHVRRCEVFGIHMLPAYDPDKHFLFERKVTNNWIGLSLGQLGAMDQVSQWPASGFWSHGDPGAGNNEEMAGVPYFQNYLRSGFYGCFERALVGARHMMEVDHVAFSIDGFQDGGMCAHCLNHNDGSVYPSHEWFTELLFAYALTGDQQFKDTALRACENLLYWIHSEMGFHIISSDQREAGQPLINLTWCYQFNPDQRYLDGCAKIINEYLMVNAKKHGRMLDELPRSMPVKIASYGDYAAWEGMFWYWTITRDESVKQFFLEQMEWRLTEPFCAMHGGHRSTDYNPMAYAYIMSGDRRWVDQVSRPLRAVFRAAGWTISWVHIMYALNVGLELGVLSDDDVLIN
ncbi:MAG: hypothetical protein CMJ49_12555 [Planctomycetaceae bacterium]|nr:hypothetical protein [Planctomycetaceae bacterium]